MDLNQEAMLKKGFAWHYIAYDKRIEFARVGINMFAIFQCFNMSHPLSKSKNCIIFSGKKRLKQREWGYGLYETRRSHGNGERNNVKADCDQICKLTGTELYIVFMHY